MINQHYREQLDYLRNLAKEFTQKHPALAPMLAGQNADPDVERLLEGTAFLSGIVKERLDDDFPELIHGLTQLLFPHYLRPLPSATIMQFTPKSSLSEVIKVNKGTTINSNPVDGHNCTFSTCADVDLHPLTIDDVEWLQGNAGQACLRLHFTLSGIPLTDWRPNSLRFHLAGPYVEASHRYSFLCQYISDVRVNYPTGSSRIGKNKFQSLIDRDELPLLDYPTNSFPAFRVLQEYYMLPQKFLFFDLVDFACWGNEGEVGQFSIDLMVETQQELPSFHTDNIELHCVPAVNLFDGEADSVILDHQKTEYKLRASRYQDQIYSLEKVVGYQQGTVTARAYRPFEMFNPNSEHIPVYSLRRRLNKISKGSSLYLSVAYPAESESLRQETLSVTVRCTNGHLPEQIQYGDICKATESSPEKATFKNILTPTKPVEPPLGDNTLWRLISHLYLNQLTLSDPEHLIALLKLYIFTDSRDRSKVQANTKRADSIAALQSQRRRRLFRGSMISGVDVNVSLNPDGFPGKGDMFVFSAVLKHLLSSFSAINCFTQLTFENMNTKESYQWPPQVGQRQLM